MKFHTNCFFSIFAHIEEKSETQSEKDTENKDQKQNDETEISVPAIITTSSFDNEGRFLFAILPQI